MWNNAVNKIWDEINIIPPRYLEVAVETESELRFQRCRHLRKDVSTQIPRRREEKLRFQASCGEQNIQSLIYICGRVWSDKLIVSARANKEATKN